MPTLAVDNNNTQLHYVDSGPVEGRVYTTVVLIHGHTFHEGTFRRLIPLASSSSLRIVALNRRDYPGSTPFNSEDFKILQSEDQSQRATFLRDRGVEIITFLDRFVQENLIPEATSDGSQGGIALLGWSLGTITSLAAIAAVTAVPPEVSQRLGKYLRTNIIFEPSWVTLGIAPPPKAYSPIYDPTIPIDKRGPAVLEWITCYFMHPDSHPDTGTLDTLEYREPYKGSDPRRASSASRLSPAEYSSLADLAPGSRSEIWFFNGESQQNNLVALTERALFDNGVSRRWPRMRTALLLCENTIWECVYATWKVLEKSREKAKENRSKPARLVFVKEANHFVHLDEPEKAIQALLECLQTD